MAHSGTCAGRWGAGIKIPSVNGKGEQVSEREQLDEERKERQQQQVKLALGQG